ncbi:MAG: ankyrin repeat domain-containing protein, partial [Acidobacteria bacterium]|nr:ankyrin repeat domain-containing protein [Acidobacteriota bacterium]
MLLTLLLSLSLAQAPNPELLWSAAKAGDTAGVERALAAGVAVDAPTRYQQTALMFAAQAGHLEVVKLLVAKGANVNQEDSFYGMTPIIAAMQDNHTAVMLVLLEKGADGANAVLGAGIRAKNADLVRAALASPTLDATALAPMVKAAEGSGDAAIIAMMKEAAANAPAPAAPSYVVPPAVLQTYTGPYRNEDQGLNATVAIKEGKAALSINGQPDLFLRPRAEGVFELEVAANTTVTFSGRGGSIERMALAGPQGNFVLARVAAGTPAAAAAPAPAETPAADAAALKTPAPVSDPRPWPSFRGAN